MVQVMIQPLPVRSVQPRADERVPA
jgi:hypothetical protein